MTKETFLFETLDVYKVSVHLTEEIAKNIILQKDIPLKPLINQLQRSTFSIPLNIAEGCGRYYPRDKIHFYHIARGSLHEVVTILHILKRLEIIPEVLYGNLYSKSIRVGMMLSGIIKSSEGKGKNDSRES